MKHVLSLMAILGVTASFSWAWADDTPPSGSTRDSCVPKSVEESLSACAGGATVANPPEKLGAAIPRLAAVPTKPPSRAGTPDATQAAEQRDARRIAIGAKVEDLIKKEIVQLEQLVKVARKSDPGRVDYIRRLAETYVEWEGLAQRKVAEADVAKNTADADKYKKTVESARASATRLYQLIVTDYGSTYAQIDEVYYYLALELEQANKLTDARASYKDIINNTPQSKYVPHAYLAFGELFFSEAQSDPSHYPFAQSSYEEVLKYPPPDNKVWGYAKYKLGYVYWNLGDKTAHLPKALASFKEVIEHTVKYASQPGNTGLGDSARRDIVPVYALVGDPSKAHDFFHPLAASPPDETKTFRMMDALGQALLDTGQYGQAITLYEDLLRRDKGDKSCSYQARIAQAHMALSGGKDKEKVAAKLLELNQQRQVFDKENHSVESKRTCANLTAELLTETAMAWHLEAVGTDASPGTCGGAPTPACAPTLKAASDLYHAVTSAFSTKDFASFEFPRIVKEDWPTLLKVKYAAADLLYFQKDWEHCGPAFDKVVEESPGSALAPEAAYASVLCYQKYYDARNGTRAGSRHDTSGVGAMPGDTEGRARRDAFFEKKPMTSMQEGMSRAFGNYLCHVKPKDDDTKAKEQYVEVKYARARTYMEAHYWEEAAVAFKDIALHHASHETGIYAAQLYLEMLNVLGSHATPKRPGCIDEIGDAVPKLMSLYCEGGKASKYHSECALLTQIQCDVERLKGEALFEKAQKGGPDAAQSYEQSARVYLGLWEKYGEAQIEAGKQPECARMDEMLYNAAEAYQSGRLIMKSISARLKLINNKNENIRKSDLARRAMYKVGGNYQAIAYYENAASWYERYAKEYPKAEKADIALADSIVLRIGLGQEKEAIANADAYMKAYGVSKPEETAKVAFAMGAYYVEREDWDNARRRLQGSIGMIDRNARVDVKVQAHAMLGRAYVNTKSDTNAAAEYKKVQDLWRQPDAALSEIKKSSNDGTDSLRRTAKTLNAVGEAYFYFAEKEKQKVDAIKFPVYTGNASDKAAVLHHVNTKVVEWLTKKKPAIEAAAREYEKILALQPEPPPRWVSAAGSRVGAMWAELVLSFRSSPIPEAWKKDPDLRDAYFQALDEKSEPFKQRAKQAFEVCLKSSVTYQFFDKYSRYCEEWLSTSYRNQFHQVDEFRVAANRVGSGLHDRAAPIDLDTKRVPRLPQQ